MIHSLLAASVPLEGRLVTEAPCSLRLQVKDSSLPGRAGAGVQLGQNTAQTVGAAGPATSPPFPACVLILGHTVSSGCQAPTPKQCPLNSQPDKPTLLEVGSQVVLAGAAIPLTFSSVPSHLLLLTGPITHLVKE